MEKPCLLIPILDQNDSVVKVLDNVTPSDWSAVMCLFDGSGWDYVKILQEHYGFLGGIHNNGRPSGFTKMANMGINLAFFRFKTDAILLDQCGTSEIRIPYDVIDKIGFLDEVFVNSGSLEDFSIRATLAGFDFKVTSDLNDFAAMQLNYKWGFKDLDFEDLLSKCLTEYKWNDSMKISMMEFSNE